MTKKQSIWLVRYGKTEYPLVEFDGPYNSDIDPSQGVEHAKYIANKIASTTETASCKIYCSPFLRCVHTASIIATKLKQEINIEEGLYEWLVSSLLIERSTNVRTYPQSISELKSNFPETVNDKYKSLNPYRIDESNDKFSFPEDESQLLSRCDDTLQLILNDDNDGVEHIIIVAHAPCVQSIAFALEDGVEDVKDSKLSKWPLGGITRFSRHMNDYDDVKWNMDFYGITDHMPGDYKEGAGLWSLSCFDK